MPISSIQSAARPVATPRGVGCSTRSRRSVWARWLPCAASPTPGPGSVSARNAVWGRGHSAPAKTNAWRTPPARLRGQPVSAGRGPTPAILGSRSAGNPEAPSPIVPIALAARPVSSPAGPAAAPSSARSPAPIRSRSPASVCTRQSANARLLTPIPCRNCLEMLHFLQQGTRAAPGRSCRSPGASH